MGHEDHQGHQRRIYRPAYAARELRRGFPTDTRRQTPHFDHTRTLGHAQGHAALRRESA